jgi:ABC-2 type transport system permease protein
LDQLELRPAPGAQSRSHIVLAQTRAEFRLLMSNGEQLLLTIIIPLGLLIGLSTVSWIDLGTTDQSERVNIVVPGIIALAVMSTAFTAQAISVGFDRRYGVLKLLGATPLSRTGLLIAKTLAVLLIEIVQIALICIVGLLLGWEPTGNPLTATALVLLGTAAFSSLALAMAGVLRAEATLAAANAVFLFLLVAGGTVIPRDRLPDWLGTFGELLPSGALGNGLRANLSDGVAFPATSFVVLIAWCAFGSFIAARTFRWE